MRALAIALSLMLLPPATGAQDAATGAQDPAPPPDTWAEALPRVPARPQTGPLGPALRALEGGDAARALVLAENDVARDVIGWMALRDGAGLPAVSGAAQAGAALPDAAVLPDPGEMARITAFLARRADWPSHDLIRSRAEARITPATPPEDVLAFFAATPPQTAAGGLALARVLNMRGAREQAQTVLITLWRSQDLGEAGAARMLADHGSLLAPHHGARTQALLWQGRLAAARRMLPLLPPAQRALAEARLAYLERAPDADTRAARLPAALRDDPGLAQARFFWLAGSGENTRAVALLAAQSRSAQALGQPARWASWRRSLARWVMRQGDAALAYDLAAHHFVDPATDPGDYADLEWLAGYLALTYLGAPDRAEAHFDAMRAVVSTPISLARADYWLGAARAAQGDRAGALAGYRAAAQHQGTFYGLLAAERLILRPASDLTGPPPPVPAVQDDLLLALDLLLQAGETAHARRFAAAIGDTGSDPVARAGAARALAAGEWTAALWLAKAAAMRGIVIPEALFPLHPMAQADLPVAPALALAVARQESEFRVNAGSGAGALGLMQLMPGTAQEMARAQGVAYDRARLLTSWPYNVALGSAYLARLQADFGDSPVLVAAAYNAGPGRAWDWMAARGDPRAGGDVVDWIEHIPFRETRNYVMRVTEAQAVYRMRLGAAPQPFAAMLRGDVPRIRPRARPAGLGRPAPAPAVVPAPAQEAAEQPVPPADAAPPMLRPRARP